VEVAKIRVRDAQARYDGFALSDEDFLDSDGEYDFDEDDKDDEDGKENDEEDGDEDDGEDYDEQDKVASEFTE
jgi:hypothetical protein